ncbi:MAG: ABC transporter permease [Oscillospiraceae bacterium]|jgi:oligopeptide transport system permease protein|nr:ABC transporter permease [Oscillospiraceae bacterium]
MVKFIVKRLAMMAATLFVILLMTFLIMHAIPGGPYSAGKRLPEAIQAALDEKYNLNAPLYVQFWDYLQGVLRFDLGPSFKYEGMSVNSLIAKGFPISAALGVFSMIFTLALSIPLGIIAALKHGRWQDTFIGAVTALGVTIPSFVVATLLDYFLAYRLGWFPVFGVATLKGYVLPVIALSGYYLAFVTRLTRSSLMDVMRSDYIRTARVKGLPEYKVVARHGLRNSLIPVVTVLGPILAGLLMGSFVVEKIFALPGMGRFFINSITNRDYTAIMGFTLFYATILVVLVFLVDIVYSIIDPRIKLGE